MDNSSKRLKNNIFYTITYQGLSFLYPLLITPTISKAFGTEVLGVYSFTYSIAYYFSLFAILGIHVYGSRLISVCRDEPETLGKVFKEIYIIQFVASVLSVSLYLVYVLCQSDQYFKCTLLQGLVIVAVMADISWFMTGIEEFKAMVFRNTVIKIVSLLLIFLLVHSKTDLYKYIIIVSGTSLIGQLLMWPLAKRYFCKVHINFRDIKKHIFPVLKLFLPVLGLNAYVLIDKTMLGVFRTMTEVGYYENFEKLIRMPIGLSSAATAAIIPRAAYYIKQNRFQKNVDLLQKTLKYNCILSLPIIMALIVMVPKLVPWYLGKDFLPCIEYIQMGAPIIFFMIANYILRMQYFVAIKQDRDYVISIIISVIINLAINLLTIQENGVYGVIFGTIISEIWACGYLIKKSKKDINYRQLLPVFFIALTSSMPMMLVIKYIGKGKPDNILTTLLQFLMGIMTYSLVYCLIEFIRRNAHRKKYN